jgi:hypothetical protein
MIVTLIKLSVAYEHVGQLASLSSLPILFKTKNIKKTLKT